MKNKVFLKAKVKFERRFYTLSNIVDEDTRDYIIKFNSKLKENDIFTHKIRIDKHKGKGYVRTLRKPFKIWVIQRMDTNWARCYKKTGLLPVNNRFAYYGDIPIRIKETSELIPKHFILLQFSEDGNTIVLDIFRDFYTSDPEIREEIVNNHKFVYNTSIAEVKSA